MDVVLSFIQHGGIMMYPLILCSIILAAALEHGIGLDSSPVPRAQVDLRFSSGPAFWHGRGSLNLDFDNVFDSRQVINFESGFSGTRFQMGRRVLFTLEYSF